MRKQRYGVRLRYQPGKKKDFKCKSRCDRKMRAKSFETQELREIGQKEAGESRDLLF